MPSMKYIFHDKHSLMQIGPSDQNTFKWKLVEKLYAKPLFPSLLGKLS